LHPDVFTKVKKEQTTMMSKYGKNLTKTQLDNECSCLNAVIKETMRIKSAAYIPWNAKDTIVVDRKKIPKEWAVACNIQITHMNDPVTFKKDGSHMDIMRGFKPERWFNEKTCPTTERIVTGTLNIKCISKQYTYMKIFLYRT